MAYRFPKITMLLTFIYYLEDQPQTSFNNVKQWNIKSSITESANHHMIKRSIQVNWHHKHWASKHRIHRPFGLVIIQFTRWWHYPALCSRVSFQLKPNLNFDKTIYEEFYHVCAYSLKFYTFWQHEGQIQSHQCSNIFLGLSKISSLVDILPEMLIFILARLVMTWYYFIIPLIKPQSASSQSILGLFSDSQ